MKTHKDLKVWQESIEFVSNIYAITANFPPNEVYGISSQLRRAALSIPSNIAEGAARKHNKEFIQFLYIALGSSMELETQLIVCSNLNFINNEIYNNSRESINSISKMLQGLIKSVKKSIH